MYFKKMISNNLMFLDSVRQPLLLFLSVSYENSLAETRNLPILVIN